MNDLEELKSLLFGAEKKTLDSLNDRVKQPETRADDIAEVLPEAVRLSHQQGGAFVTELKDPVTHCLKQSFQEAPQEYADVLYPIMGPAIRKSISHALKAFAQQINQTMEYSLSAKGLSWRWQALRSGVPFSDFVMQRTLQYRVEQAYLISRENGLLMAHVHHQASRIKDSDAVSAMFTAIQDFVKESFSPDSNSRLETADMGEFTLWAVHGPHALMVCVIRGVPPRALRAELSAILERIHFRYGDALRAYAGDTSTVDGVELELTQALEFQALQNDGKKSRKIWFPLIVAALLLIGLAGYFGYKRWQNQQQLDRLMSSVENVPGIYVANASYADGQYTLHGLRDPLADDIQQVALQSGLESHQLSSDFRPYRSLDPEIVFRRALSVLNPPESVNVTRSTAGLDIAGQAHQQWIDSLGVKISADTIGLPVTTDNLVSINQNQASPDRSQLETSIANVSGTVFYFSSGDNLIQEDQTRLKEFATELKTVSDRASGLNEEVSITVVGNTDSTGSAEYNAVLAKARAKIVTDALTNAGIISSLISTQESVMSGTPNEESNPSRRSAAIFVGLKQQ